MNDTDDFLAVLVLLALIIFLLPTLVAFWRRHPNRWVIGLLNVFLGATGIVWFACLIWAFRAVHISVTPLGTHGGESGLNLLANDYGNTVLYRNQELVLPSVAQPDTVKVLEKLERLKKLHDDEVIDDQQFHRMRAAILSNA